jgi:phosphoenolpyruvate-protein kinase (PTS system EI component)
MPTPDVPLGLMVEVPGTVPILGHLLDHVQFVSVGTNDLIQYTLAVDRNNEKVAHLYDPLHPGVIALIREVAHVCRRQGKAVTVCGESAAHPLCAYLYLGMGVDALSLNPPSIPAIKQLLRRVSWRQARRDLERAASLATASEVAAFLESRLEGLIP